MIRTQTKSRTERKASVSFANPQGEEQLKYFLSLIQQYHENYHEALDFHSEILKKSINFQNFVLKIATKSELQLRKLFEDLKQILIMLQKILTKSLVLLPETISNIVQSRNKRNSINEQLNNRQLTIDQLIQQNSEINKHLSEISVFYEKSRNDNLQLNERITRKQQQFQLEAKEIKKSLVEITEFSETQKKLLVELYETNEKLTQSLNTANIQKTQIHKEMSKTSLQLDKLKGKVVHLENQLSSKQLQIRNYELQINSLHKSNQHRYSQQQLVINSINESDYQRKPSFSQSADQKIDEKANLNEDLKNYQMGNVMSLSNSIFMGNSVKMSSTNSFVINEGEDSRKFDKILSSRKQTNDPYFSHYILISQAVKIKEDCEDMLSVDMKPYYREIIQKRVPMHLWDQWVKNRLRELLRKGER